MSSQSAARSSDPLQPAGDGPPLRVGMVGLGLIGQAHLGTMIGRPDTVIAAVCDPNPAAVERTRERMANAGGPAPVVEPSWGRFLEVTARDLELDAVLIATPHVLHFEQATAALETGLDVLLEKPMVMTAGQAVDLIGTRDRTGRLLVVAFQGSLSPYTRAAAAMIRSGEAGAILNIDAMAWQNWGQRTAGTWRQDPGIAGGGFLFDTGAHMLNTVADVSGEDVTQVAAWLEDDGTPVDERGVVIARLASGALITMNGCGMTIPSLGSDIRVFCERAILRLGIWGERFELQRAGSKTLRTVRSVQKKTVWQQFVDVRAGREANPSPPEVGLRMARLWDAIKESSARGGALVSPIREVQAA
jgi:predicted dehydrogenase